MPPRDMEMHNNLLMINAMKEHGTLLWYKPNFDVNDFVTDQPTWKVLSQKTRLKITWLKENWLLIREQYRHDRQAEFRDPSIQRTTFLEKYGDHLTFLESNAKEWATLLCGGSPSTSKIEADNSRTCNSNDSEIGEDKNEFHNARKRLASQIEDVEFIKTVRSKLQKFEPTEKDQLKKEILDMLNKK
ncbi:uncharacterized protein LOC119075674 [Bradysia coprophila]|uniref:uncharacterized protein LOC119075674 n=1 Tax=Bradysia coprophila TaxID=38358 RepID=UPI00187DC2D9|nr:uncharacterized protein LOC119075674 [Bradysia coprophila]